MIMKSEQVSNDRAERDYSSSNEEFSKIKSHFEKQLEQARIERAELI
jgi:hypothetical protein